MKTLIDGPVYVVSMPLDKGGNGPALPWETVITQYEVWDQVLNVICVCREEEDALMIAQLINEGNI